MKKQKKQKKQGRGTGPCEVRICENPDTGDWYVKATGPCAQGYLDKAYESIQKNGLVFPKPPEKKSE